MLRVDRRSAGIPVFTCPTSRDQNDPDDDFADLDEDTATPSIAASMN
jgi:hypothetical protein